MLNFSTINPFLGKDIAIKNSADQLDISAGLKGTIFPQFGFKVYAYRNRVEDLPMFVSNFDFAHGYNRFNVIYATGTTTMSGIKAELDFKASEDIDFLARLSLKATL